VIRIGITGHIRLQPSSGGAIYTALVALLRTYPAVHGVTCLAEGSDRLFVDAIRDCAGTYEVVLPQPPGTSRRVDRTLRGFLRRAVRVRKVRVPGAPEKAYAAASREMLDRSEILIAVWDGVESGGPGGTADTVARARAEGKEVVVIWPEGAERAAEPAPAGVTQSAGDSSRASVLIVT
jgi:hypothetical protein